MWFENANTMPLKTILPYSSTIKTRVTDKLVLFLNNIELSYCQYVILSEIKKRGD
jgi:hypothetical protein